MAGPYTVALPVQGQPISSSQFGIPVKNAIDDLHTRAVALETSAQAVVARGRRNTSKTVSAGSAATETGFLRLDNIPVRANTSYRIMTSQVNLIASVANDTHIAQIRWAYAATPGTSAAVGGNQLQNVRVVQVKSGASDSITIPMSTFYFATADGFLSLLVSFRRINGTGSIQFYAGVNEEFDITVEFAGPTPADTAVVL